MLSNRIQSTASVLFQSQFGFATKNLKQIKIRMKAVESIKKITKAMKMVAAAKMKQDVARLERAKTFGVGTIQRVINNETYLAKKKANFTAKKFLLVPITSDKGLCGGVNSNIIREVKAMVKADRSAYKLFVVGDKGSVALSRPMADLLDSAITHVITPMNFPTGAPFLTQPPPSPTRPSSTPRTATASF
jgi:F-type H+-transporting ATPase subunit gamma